MYTFIYIYMHNHTHIYIYMYRICTERLDFPVANWDALCSCSAARCRLDGVSTMMSMSTFPSAFMRVPGFHNELSMNYQF